MAAYSYSQQSGSSANSSLPQGFSIHQAALGAPLQFFPAVGTQQHDDLLHAYLPGSASIQEKRATVSVDFLEHAQLTGQNFKFYPVFSIASAPQSPALSSPFQAASSISSLNVSPLTPSWDFSQVSSQSSTSSRSRKHSKHVSSRHQPTDFSHIPGMKIMTKDGLDVTNSASRGSKTKEQRDHAHLMRVIKACESCRKKKVRCDPSHKRRSAAQAPSQPVAAKTAKKAKAAAAAASAPVAVKEQTQNPASLFNDDFMAPENFGDLDTSLLFSELEGLEPVPMSVDPWNEFIQYPPMGPDDYDYDFFFDPEGHLSPQSSSSGASFSGTDPSTTKPVTPAQWHVPTAMPVPEDKIPPRYRDSPLREEPGSALSACEPFGSYADFNLYSPESSFSEDDRMVNVASSSSSSAAVSGHDGGQISLFAESLPQDRVTSHDPAGGVLARSEWSHPGILATDDDAVNVFENLEYSDPAGGRADVVRRQQQQLRQLRQPTTTSASADLYGRATNGGLDAWGTSLAGHCSPLMENVPLSQIEHDSVLATLVTGNISSTEAATRRLQTRTTAAPTSTTTTRASEGGVLPLSVSNVEATRRSTDVLVDMRQRVSSSLAETRDGGNRSPDVLDSVTRSATYVESTRRSSDVLDAMSQRVSHNSASSSSTGDVVQAPEKSVVLHNVLDGLDNCCRQGDGSVHSMPMIGVLLLSVGFVMWLNGYLSVRAIVSTISLGATSVVKAQFKRKDWQPDVVEQCGNDCGVSSLSRRYTDDASSSYGTVTGARDSLSCRVSRLARSRVGAALTRIGGRVQ